MLFLVHSRIIVRYILMLVKIMPLAFAPAEFRGFAALLSTGYRSPLALNR